MMLQYWQLCLMSVLSEFDQNVADSDAEVFECLGVASSVTLKGATEPLPSPVVVVYDNEFRIQGEEGNFVNTYGGRSDGLTTNTHFLQFRKSEFAAPGRGARMDLVDGRTFILAEPVNEDQFTFTYAVESL